MNLACTVTGNLIMDLAPALQADTKNTGFNEFDALLSQMLKENTDNQQEEDNIKTCLAALYTGALGSLLTVPDRVLVDHGSSNDNLQAANTAEAGNVSDEKVMDSVGFTNQFEKFVNSDIDFKQIEPYLKIHLPESDYEEQKQILLNLENVIKSKLSGDKSVEEFTDFNFLQGKDVMLSLIPDENLLNLITDENAAKSGEELEVYQYIEAFKEKIRDVKILDNPRQEEKPQKVNLDIEGAAQYEKTAHTKILPGPKSTDSSFSGLKEDSGLNTNKSPDDSTRNKTEQIPYQKFDFYVFHEKEVARGDTANEITEKIDVLAEAVGSRIIKSAVFTEQSGKQEFEIQLKPNFLGKIIIKLEKGTDGFRVKILTSNLNVKEALTSQFPKMQETLKSQGIDLNNAELVYTGLAQSERDFTGGGRSYKNTNAKSISRAKSKYEMAVISGIPEVDGKVSANPNGSLNYLV